MRKRNKATLVCTNCKKRKIKCDRKMPCLTCVKSNTGYSCTYELKWRPISFNGSIDDQSIDEGLLKGSIMATLPDSHLPLHHQISNIDTRLHDSHDRTIARHIHDINRIEKNHGSATALDELAALRSKLNQLENSLTKLPPSSYSSPSTLESAGFVNAIDEDNDDYINFYEGCAGATTTGTFRRTSFGPLAWISLMRRDPWLSLVWKTLDTKQQAMSPTGAIPPINQENNLVFNAPPEANQASEKSFQKRALEIEGYAEILPFKMSLVNTRWNLNVSTLTLAKTLFEGKTDPALQLIEQIKQIMPKKKVLWTLVDRFFTNLYPFNPFLDEAEFRKDLSSILGPISYADEPLDQVNIERKLDLAYIAICFFMLRLTYVSMFSNRDCINAHILESRELTEEKYLLTHPINLAMVDVARACVECFQILRKFNLIIFQAVLFMRLYSSQAPEDGDGIDGGDSQVAMGTLVQMAYSLGLHREPDNFLENQTDEKTKHIGRKIWHFLLRQDVVNCFSIGNFPQIDDNHYDTKVPFANTSNSNILHIDMERSIAELFAFNRAELDPFREVLDLILDLQNRCKVKNFVTHSDKAEQCVGNLFDVLPDFPDEVLPMAVNGEQFALVVKSKVFIIIKFSLVSIYFHLYLHHESRTKFEASFHYLMKIYNIITDSLLPYIFEVINGRLSNHGLNLNPAVLMALHKSNQFCLSNLTRVNYLIFSMTSKQDHDSKLKSDYDYRLHFNRIVTLLESIKLAVDTMTKIFEKFALRYYYAWRVCKAYRLLHKHLKREDFYKRPPAAVKKLHSFQYTSNQLDQITRSVQKLCKSAEAIIHYEDSFEKYPENPLLGKTVAMRSPISVGKFATKMERTTTPGSVNSTTPDLNYSSTNQELDQMWLLMMLMKPEQDLNGPFVDDFESLGHRLSISGPYNGTPQPEFYPTKVEKDGIPLFPSLDQKQTAQSHLLPPTTFPACNSLFAVGAQAPYFASPQDVSTNGEDLPMYFGNESDLVALYNLEQLLN